MISSSGLTTEAELADSIIRERNRIADHAGADEEEPPGPPACRGEGLRAGEAGVSALVCRHGSVWAARVKAGPVTVTIVGRDVGPDSVRLNRVTDLEPYLQTRGEMLAGWPSGIAAAGAGTRRGVSPPFGRWPARR